VEPASKQANRVSGQRTNWSRDQYEDYCRRTGQVSEFVKPIGKTLVEVFAGEKKPVAGRTAPRKGKTKTESEFETWYKFGHPTLTLLYEAIKLRIDLTCWYLPDFYVPEQQLFIEVKGPYIWPDALIKFKAARAMNAWAKFAMWQKKKGGWTEVYALEDH
jgi:hypothetical protein